MLNEGFRYRDLDSGTFITPDPLGFVDGPNRYTYVNDNPWTHFDPEGLSEDKKDPPPPPPPAKPAPAAPSGQQQAPAKPTNESPSKDQGTKAPDSTSGSSQKSIKESGRLAVDTDGTGPAHGDEHHQDKTSGMMDKDGKIVPKYLPGGKLNPAGVRDLNADTDAYGVAPASLSKDHGGPLQAGDKKTVTTEDGKRSVTVPIGDFGPEGKHGEVSVKAVQDMGLKVLPGTKNDPNPEPSINGKTTPNIKVNVEYFPNSH